MKTLHAIGLLLLFTLPSVCFGATEIVGEFVLARGDVELQRNTDGSRFNPKVGDKIHLDDRIITKKNGFAKLLLKDKSILKVSPSSQLTVSIQLLGPQDSNTTINLLRGKLRALVVEKVGENSKYEVHTSVAVAGVRGTDFEVVAEGKTTVRCFTGHVEITNIDKAIKGSVLLGPNTYTQVNAGLPPLQPLPLPPGFNRGDTSGVLGDGNNGVFSIDDIIANITNQTLDDIMDDISDRRSHNRNLDPYLEVPLYGDNIDGRIEQLPDIGTQIPFLITIPTP